MAKVVGIGAMVFDILMTIDSFPREDTKLRGEETKFQCGGPCATGLVAISKLGESACYMGTVGDDMYGSFVRGELYCMSAAGDQSAAGYWQGIRHLPLGSQQMADCSRRERFFGCERCFPGDLW